MSRSTGIEIAFRTVPGAGLMVPDEITIQTLFSGPIAVNAQEVDIKTSDHRKTAFVKERGRWGPQRLVVGEKTRFSDRGRTLEIAAARRR